MVKSYDSFIPLSCAQCDDSLPFSGAYSIPLCYVRSPATLLHQLFFHPLSTHIAIYFFVYLSILLFPNSYILPFWEIFWMHVDVENFTVLLAVQMRKSLVQKYKG